MSKIGITDHAIALPSRDLVAIGTFILCPNTWLRLRRWRRHRLRRDRRRGRRLGSRYLGSRGFGLVPLRDRLKGCRNDVRFRLLGGRGRRHRPRGCGLLSLNWRGWLQRRRISRSARDRRRRCGRRRGRARSDHFAPVRLFIEADRISSTDDHTIILETGYLSRLGLLANTARECRSS